MHGGLWTGMRGATQFELGASGTGRKAPNRDGHHQRPLSVSGKLVPEVREVLVGQRGARLSERRPNPNARSRLPARATVRSL